MMDDYVLIPYGSDAGETARKLLDAADDPAQVRHQPDDGGFRVPESVGHKAGFGEPDEPETSPEEDAPVEESEKKAPAKKAPARKRTTKKTAAKG